MKSIRSQNALTHGVYAQETVLPWEDADEFAAFLQAVRIELQPVGPLEEAAVYDVADLHWRKRRLAIGALLSPYKDQLPPELAEAAKHGVGGLAEYITKSAATDGTIWATGDQVLTYVKAKMGSGPVPELPRSASPAQMSLERAYDPTEMATFLKTEAMLDARIAKAMARLVHLKDYKIIYHERDWTPEGQKPGWTVMSASQTKPAIPKG